MIAIIDYDAGNLRSVEKAVTWLGKDPVITRDSRQIFDADHIILPGVGAFGDAMNKLNAFELVPVIREAAARGIPILGICLGLQLFFPFSEESPEAHGIGLLEGSILEIPHAEGLKVPHIGWNSLTYDHPGRLFRGIPENSCVYFVHSFYLKADDPSIVTASTVYGVKIHAAVEKDNIFACQFHPEKSGEQGLMILNNFLET